MRLGTHLFVVIAAILALGTAARADRVDWSQYMERPSAHKAMATSRTRTRPARAVRSKRSKAIRAKARRHRRAKHHHRRARRR
jgi:hypothetical protein